MMECNYAKEPFDLRLTILILIKKTGVIIMITLLGILLFGGGYFIKNIVFGPADTFTAISMYKVTYATDPQTDKKYTYINGETWSGWLHTDEFINLIQEHLTIEIEREQLESYLSADLPSNLSIPISKVTSPDPETSLAIAAAVEKSFVDFGDRQKEIESIRVVDSAKKAEKTLVDVRPLRAFILSGVLTLFLTIMIIAIWEIGSDNIWLPVILTKRYGLKTIGTIESKYFKENINYLFKNQKETGVIPLDANVDVVKAVNILKENTKKSCCGNTIEEKHWIGFPSVSLSPESCEKLREMDGILLIVPAGSGMGKRLESVLEFMSTQECKITAAMLWAADEKLIRRYYRFSKEII